MTRITWTWIALVAVFGGRALGAAAPPEEPNFLVIFSDDQTYRAIGYANAEVKTPNLDALAGSGLIFDRAYVASPICAASRASIITGVYPQQHGVIGLGAAAFKRYRTGGAKAGLSLARQLADLGYTTAFYGKSHLGPPTDYGFEHGQELAGHDDRKTFAMAEKFLREQATRHEPFLLWVAPRQPHVPLLPEKRWLNRYDSEELSLPDNFRREPTPKSVNNQGRPGQHYYRDSEYRNNHRQLSAGPPRDEATMRQFIRAYYAVVSHLDHQVGRLVEQLESRGLRQRTMIVFLSDNGYHLGSHGLGNKITMHEESVRVPMFMTGPGVPKGRKSQALVSSLDVYPTLLELAGADLMPAHLMGKSLVPLLRDPEDRIRATVFSECVGVGGGPGEGHRMARSDRWKYILTGTNEPYLFDQRDDPHEMDNRIDDPERANVASELRGELSRWMEAIGDRSGTGK